MEFEFDTLPDWPLSTVDAVKAAGRSVVSGPFGSNIGSRFFVSEGVPIIRGNNLTAGRKKFVDSGFVFLTEEKAKEFPNCVAIRGDIVFTAAGTIGQVGIIPENSKFSRYIISNKQLRVRFDTSRVLSAFAYYWFSSSAMIQLIRSCNTGSTIPLINLSVLKSLPIPVPDIKLQGAVIEILSGLDDRIDLLVAENETLESLAQAIFKSWFVDFDPVRAKAEGSDPEGMDVTTARLFPCEFQETELGRIPSGWSISTIGQTVNVIDCLHSKKPERLDQGKPFLQLSNIRDNGIVDMSDTYYISDRDYEKWISRIEASPGDCVITNVGRVGAVAQIPTGVNAALGRNMTGLRCKEDFPFATFLIELMMSDAMREEISLKTDSGTILDSLNVRSIPRLRFVRPSGHVLRHFEDSSRPLRARMELNCERIRTLTELRNTLLPRLISGKLRVPDAEKLVEAVL